MDPLRWIDDALQDLDDRHLVRQRQVRSGPQSPASITLNGESLVNFASNDYLGLAAEDLLENVRGSLQPVGWGSGASPLIIGHGDLHAELEAALAQFEQTSAALLFSSGYAANVGTITALTGQGALRIGIQLVVLAGTAQQGSEGNHQEDSKNTETSHDKLLLHTVKNSPAQEP